MRVEVCCPACNKGYLLDQISLGGEFVCPACLARIDLSLAANPGPLVAAAAEAPGPAVAAQPVPGTATVASAVTSADPTAVAASTTAACTWGSRLSRTRTV